MSQLSIFATDVLVTHLGNMDDKVLLRFQTILPKRKNPELHPAQQNMESSVENDISILLDKKLALQISHVIQEYTT